MPYSSFIESTTSKDDPRFKDLYLFHGKSAYQAAVEYGFPGTEEEWLSSLRELRWGTMEEFEGLSELNKQPGVAYIDTLAGKIFRYDAENQEFVDSEISTYDKEGNPIHLTFLKRSGGIMTGENPILFEKSEDDPYISNHIRFNTGNDRIGADKNGNLGIYASGATLQFRVDRLGDNRGVEMSKNSLESVFDNDMTLGSDDRRWKHIYGLGIGSKVDSESLWGVRSGITEDEIKYIEIFTGDCATEPIFVRQYRDGVIWNNLVLLDESGNTHIPYTLYAVRGINTHGNVELAGDVLSTAETGKNIGSEDKKWANVYADSFVGNASTASVLETARKINVDTAVTGTAQFFNGSEDIVIPITAIDPSYISQSVNYRLVSDAQIEAWNAKPTQAELSEALANLVNGSPDLLNTLDELAAALGDDPNFATTMATELGKKFDKVGGPISGDVSIEGALTVTGATVLAALSASTGTFSSDVSVGGNLYPATNNAKTLGTSGKKWANVYATSFTGNLVGNADTATVSSYLSLRHSNEINFRGNSTQTRIWFNYRDADADAVSTTSPITEYRFGNKNGDTSGVTLYASAFSGNAATSTVAAKLGRGGNTSVPMIFNWSGKDGQPTWLWGGTDGTNMYVYNPSNFDVNGANWLKPNSTLKYGVDGLQYFNLSMAQGSTANANQAPTADWYHVIRMNHANANGYYTDIACSFHDNTMWYRRIASGTSSGWIKLLDSGNFKDYALSLANGGTVNAATTFAKTLTVTGASNFKSTISCTTLTSTGVGTFAALELSAATPYIDFHFNKSSADYTTRLQEKSSGALNCTGTFTATKVYNAVWNDYAEWYEREDIEEIFEPGDIVTWSEDGVVKTTEAFDPCVVGVYSNTYGHVVGGESLDNMEDNIKKNVPVGLCGRVYVKVVGKANKGDLIVSSDIPGVGMAISPKDAYPGVVVGKVLKKKESEEIEKVKIQIMLQ